MAKVSAIDKYLKEQQKKEEQQRKKQVESQTKVIQSTNKDTNMDSGVSDSIKNLLKKQTQTSNNKSTSFLSGTPKREEVKPVQIKKNVPERSFLTGEQEDSKVVNQSQKKKLTDYSSIGEYRKAEQENYKKNKEIALQDEALQSILAMDQTKERDMAKDKYMRDTNLSWRLNELRNKNNKSIEEENELAQLEHKLLELTNLRRANDTLVDDAILDAAGVVSNTYNSAAYNTDLLLQSIFNPNEKLVETRNADLVNQINTGRANTTQALNDSYGEWAGFLYQTGLSISDNLALRVLNALAPGASLIAMGSNAAASKALEIGQQDDATAFEQLGRGLSSGGIEFLTEKMSFGALDNLLGGKNSRSVLRGMIDQAIEEGREEGLSYAFNLGADALWGDEVQWNWGEFAQSVLGGAISGGVMGGPSTFIGNQRFNRMARDIKNNANVQQQFKDKANIEDISMMSDEEFADLLSNSFESIKDDVGEKKFNKMKIDEIMELVPDHMTKGEKKMWQAGNDLDFQQAIQMKSQDPLTAMTSRDLVKQNVRQVAQDYGLNERTVEVINGVVDSTGVNVVFTTDMKGQEDADGYYQNGTIYINPNGKKPYMQILKHELTHHIQYNQEFADIKNYLISEYQGTDASAYRDANGNIKHFTFNDLVARTAIRYAEAGQQLSMEDAEFEALADLVSTSSLFADEKGISKLANTHTDASLKEKIADFFGNMAGRFNGNSEYKHELERVRDLYVNSTYKEETADNFDFADFTVKYSLAKDALKNVNDVINKKVSLKKGTILLDDTPEYIVDLGYSNLPIAMYNKHIVSNVLSETEAKEKDLIFKNFHYHGLGTEKFLELLNGLYNPNKVYRWKNNNEFHPWKNEDTFTVITDKKVDDKTVVIGLQMNSKKNLVSVDVHLVTTVHGRTTDPEMVYESYKNEGYVTEVNIKKEPNLPRAYMAAHVGMVPDANISQNNKMSIDSLGNSLSKEQQEYFKNSKVVDKDGNLKVMYRGGNEDINVFDRKKSRASNLYGRGFYFTDSEAHAKQYGEAREYYLNITNPLWNEKNITREQIVKLLQAIEDDGEDMDLSNYGYGATVDSIADSLMEKDDYGKLFDISTTAVGDLVKTTELFNELNGTTYDGFILPTETVVFNSNQIKKVDNINPTSNPDVRYSISSKYTNDLKDIMKKYGSLQMRNSQEVDQVLSDIAKEIASTGYFTDDNKNKLMQLIRTNVIAAREDTGNVNIYKDIKKQYSGTRLFVDPKYESFLKRHNIRNKLRGLFTITTDKANADYSIDSFYNELVENYNGIFEQVDTEQDQLLELVNKLKEIKFDTRKTQPIGETNEYFFSEQGVVDDINKYLNTMKARINQMPDAVKNRVNDVYTLLNAERFVEKNTRLQNFNKFYFNNINAEAARTLGVYANRSENTQKLFQNAIQEVAEGGDITNKTRDALINDLVSHLDKTNEIKLDEYTEQQMKFFKADTDSTFKSIVKDELNNLIRDVQFAMAYADGELLDDKAIKQAQTRYEKQLREETRNTKVKMASEIVGRTPQQQLKKMGVFDVLQTKESFNKTNEEFDNGIAKGDDVGQITGLDAAMINELRENGVDKTSFNKTLSQVFDVIAGKSPRLREMLRASIERPLDNAKKRMFDDQKHNLEKLSQAMKKYGIKAGSKESKAVQWYGEGTKDVNDPEAKPYTLVDLQQEFPDKWQDIVAFEKFCREMYDEYFERINQARQSIYPNPLDQAYVDLANAQERIYKCERIIANSKTNNIYDENFISKQYENLERAKNDVQRITEAINNGDYTLNKVLPKRKDYFHHFQEITAEHGNVLKIINNPNDYKISNKLSGLSEGTKPKAKFTGFMQHREHGDYEADAVGGLLKYITVAEYAIHIDPQTAHLRGIIKAMRDTSNASDTDLAYTINYLTHFANNLAGKTFMLDRIITDVFHGRKAMQVLKAINNMVKGNAILGNMRSAISQFYNLPTGLSMIKNPASMAKGAMQYARYLKGEKNAVDIMNQSSFLQERYFDKVYDELDLNDDSQIKKMATWMMQFGDEVVSRNIWFGAYEDAIAQNMNQQEAISYADNLTRNAVAGRGIGEVPLLQQSEVVKLFAPFQVEVNNQWQYLKQLTNDVVNGGPDEKKKAAWQMFVMFAVTWGMNELREKLLDGNRTGMDMIDAFTDVFNSVNEGDVSFTTTAGRVGGEILSNVPFATQIIPFVGDGNATEALFGDADPTRYGTQNIGLSALLSPIVAASQGKDIDVQGLAFDYLTPWGGSQLDRTIGYMQDRGWIPDLKVNTKEGISLEQNEVAGSYSDNRRLRFALDEEDVPETVRGLLFGTTGTQAAREYYDNGAKSLSDAKTQAYVEARKAGATYKEMDGVMTDITKFESLKDNDGDSITYSKGKQTADYIDDLSMNAKAKETLYKTYALSDTQREVYDRAIAAGGSYNQLKDAMFDIAMMESIKDKNGKSISNSKALQTAKYINELNVSDKVKDVLREEYLSKTVKEMSMGEVYGRLKNLGVGGTSSTSSYRSSRSKKTSVPSVSSRIRSLLNTNSSNKEFTNRLKQIVKEFESKSKVS